jgi:hypothetical protein
MYLNKDRKNCTLYFVKSNDINDLIKSNSLGSVYDLEILKSDSDSIKYGRVETQIVGALRYTTDEDISSFIEKSDIIVEVIKNKSSYSSFHLEPSSSTEVRIIMYELLNFSEIKEFENIGSIERRLITTIEIEIKPIKVVETESNNILRDIKSLIRDNKLDNLLGNS